MKKFVEFNINGTVWVRLTEDGRAELQRQRDEINKIGGPFTHPLADEDASGWSKWQAWDLMGSLGHMCGMARPMPFEPTIRIEVDA